MLELLPWHQMNHTCFGLPELEDSNWIKHTNSTGTVGEYNIGGIFVKVDYLVCLCRNTGIERTALGILFRFERFSLG